MKVYVYNQKSIQKKQLIVFCEVISQGDQLVFINRVSGKSVRKMGNSYISDILAKKLNEREDADVLRSLFALWRSDYETVLDELTEEGYFG